MLLVNNILFLVLPISNRFQNTNIKPRKNNLDAYSNIIIVRSNKRYFDFGI